MKVKDMAKLVSHSPPPSLHAVLEHLIEAGDETGSIRTQAQ